MTSEPGSEARAGRTADNVRMTLVGEAAETNERALRDRPSIDDQALSEGHSEDKAGWLAARRKGVAVVRCFKASGARDPWVQNV